MEDERFANGIPDQPDRDEAQKRSHRFFREVEMNRDYATGNAAIRAACVVMLAVFLAAESVAFTWVAFGLLALSAIFLD